MVKSVEKTLVMKSSIIYDNECLEDEGEALILFAEALRFSMLQYANRLKRYKRAAIAAIVAAGVTFVIALNLTDFIPSIAVYFNVLPVLLFITGVHYFWKQTKIKPEYKIRNVERAEYPIALYREDDGRFIVLDAGAAVSQQEYSFPAIKDLDRFGDSVVRVRNQVSQYWDLLGMGGSQQAETLRARTDFDDVMTSGRMERIVERPMENLVDSIDEANIVRTQMRAPVIQNDDPIVNEIETLASFAELETSISPEKQGTDILMNRGLCLEIPPNSLLEQAQKFRTWSKEALEQDVMTLVKDVVVNLEKDFPEISHILRSMPALIEATVPYSVREHEDFMYFHFCPQCHLSDLEEAERETDFKRWVDEKILGNALQDPDLVQPHAYGDSEAVNKARRHIDEIIQSSLPLADPVFPVMLADLRELTLDELGNYRCESCGYQGEGIEVPRSIHPLASGYLLNLREQAKHIQNKSDVIIRNVHDVIMNKESKLIALGPYEQSVQQAEQNRLEVKGDLEAASEVKKVVNLFERESRRGR